MTAGVKITTDLELVEMPEITYPAVSEAVGGYIQLVALRGAFKGFSMYVHEEGKMLGLPFNDIATAIWEKSFGKMTDYILGNAVVVSSKIDDEGNELPFTDEEVEKLLEATKNAVYDYGQD